MYNITYEEILKRMLDRVSSKFDKREGSVIFDTHSPTAIELQIIYTELNTILAEAYGDSASREYLIKRCKERGITPYEATNAVWKGEFTPTTIDVTGRRFNIGSTNYVVTEKMADGIYHVKCETAGMIGNQQFGNMLPMEYIEGLEAAELTELLIPGEDEEETEDLRTRYSNSFNEKAFGGNVQDYLEKTNAISGVGSTKVTRVWNTDISPAGMMPTKAVTEWFHSVIGTLEGEVAGWLAGIYAAAAERKLTTGGTVRLTILDADFSAASNALVQAVQNAVDPPDSAGEGHGLAPIGHVVTVESAKEVAVTVKSSLVFDAGYGWENLQDAICSAISGYLLELRESWGALPRLVVRISQIEIRLLGIRGIVDIEGTSINGSEKNLALDPYEIPVFGGVDIW